MSDSSSTAKVLRIEIEPRDEVIVVRLSGSADMENAVKLQDKLLEVVTEHPRQLILDLSGLNFISSEGLGGIIAAHLRSRHHNGLVKLVAPQPAIMEVLEVTKLTKLFPIFDTIQAALALPS